MSLGTPRRPLEATHDHRQGRANDGRVGAMLADRMKMMSRTRSMVLKSG